MRQDGRWLLAFGVAGCSLTTPQSGSYRCDASGNCLDGFVCNAQNLCVTAAAANSSGSSTTTGAGTSGGSTTGGGTSGGASGTVTSSGNNTSTGSSSSVGSGGSSGGSSSSGAVLGSFAGEWDMNFAHVSLIQAGSAVTGKYRDWGYSYLDPVNAGTIAGTVQGNAFSGTFQDNAADPSATVMWTLSAGQLAGAFGDGGTATYPWCGVAAGQGTPLPVGCGWSDAFITGLSSQGNATAVTLQQIADEVSGIYSSSGEQGTLTGVVSDFRVNGRYLNTALDVPGRFSFWMTLDGTQFTGNYFNGSNKEWCGVRGMVGSMPTPCLGGGGFFDGSWFTNLGAITLTQPEPSSSPATGIWYGWGSDIEYPIAGLVSGPDAGGPGLSSSDFSLSWSDSSPLGGALGMSSLPTDGLGLTLSGQAVAGGLWCGVSYGPNPLQPDGGQIGTLFQGCGLSNSWDMWDPAATNAREPPQLVQTRGTVAGTTDAPFDLDTISGSVAFNPLQDAGVGSWTVVTGSWTDLPDAGGSFTWYPDSQDQTFAGDFTAAGAGDAGPWCGSVSLLQPSPCFE